MISPFQQNNPEALTMILVAVLPRVGVIVTSARDNICIYMHFLNSCFLIVNTPMSVKGGGNSVLKASENLQ